MIIPFAYQRCLLIFLMSIVYACSSSTSSEHHQTPSSIKITCLEDTKDPDKTVKYCYLHHYRSVTTMTEDYKGRGETYYHLEKKVGGIYRIIKTDEFFIKENGALLERINQEIKRIYQELEAAYPNDPCFEEIRLEEQYTFGDVSPNFHKDGLFFAVNFRLSSACLAIDGNGFLLPWEEVKPFIKF